MGTEIKVILNQMVAAIPGSTVAKQGLNILARQDISYKAKSLMVALGFGLILGGIVLYTRELPAIWAAVVIVAAIAPTIALLVGNIEKLSLIIFVVDIPLGLNIALGNRTGKTGDTAGFLVSLMTIMLIVAYAHWVKGRPFEEKSKFHHQHDITIPILIYLFFMLVSVFQSADKWFSITQLFLELQFFLMYFYVANHVRSWADVRLIFNVLAVCVFIEGMVMLAQFYFGFQPPTLGTQAKAMSDVAGATTRVGGTFGVTGANAAAAFLAVSLAIIFTAFLGGSRFINKQLALAAIFPSLVALVLTGSRGGWIGFIIALLLIITRAFFRRVGIKIIMLLFFTITILSVTFSPIIINRFIGIEEERSARSRLWYSELALNFIREDMFTGAGANNQEFVLEDKDYAPPELAKKESLTHIHNKYLAVWVELGLFGFLAFFWLLLAGARRAWVTSNRTNDRLVSIVVTGLLAALSVFLIHMVVATYTDRRMQYVWLLLGLIAATSRMAKEAHGFVETAK